MSLGLCGAYKTGKSALAKALASRTGRQFVPTHVSAVFAEFGVDPAIPMNFQTRLRIQNQILDSCERVWLVQKDPFVTDRTPIDLMAYTLADIQASTEVNFTEFEEYTRRCFEVTNKVFDALIVLQPNTILARSTSKETTDRAYVEHLNTIIIGLCNDERLECGAMYIRRDMTDVGERVQKVLGAELPVQKENGALPATSEG